MKQTVLDKLREAQPEDMGRDVMEFFGWKPGELLDWNADELVIGDESIPMAEVLATMKEADAANGVRTVDVLDLIEH